MGVLAGCVMAFGELRLQEMGKEAVLDVQVLDVRAQGAWMG